VLYGGYFNHVNDDARQTASNTLTLGYSWRSLHFEYSSPIFEEQSNAEYSYLLEGFDKEWSDWSKKSEKDYTNLPAGSYIFKVKARNHQNNESAVAVMLSISTRRGTNQYLRILYTSSFLQGYYITCISYRKNAISSSSKKSCSFNNKKTKRNKSK
jgi:hypothetical protein